MNKDRKNRERSAYVKGLFNGTGISEKDLDMDAIITPEEIDLLARLIQAEAGAEPLEGKIAVGAVIINRLHHIDFPDTIQEIIMQDRQFEPVTNGALARIKAPDAECFKAAEMALAGKDPTRGALFFFNPMKSNSKWLKSKKVSTRLGKHVFMG